MTVPNSGYGSRSRYCWMVAAVQRGVVRDVSCHRIGDLGVEVGDLGAALVVVLRGQEVDVVVDVEARGPCANIGDLQGDVPGELLLDVEGVVRGAWLHVMRVVEVNVLTERVAEPERVSGGQRDAGGEGIGHDVDAGAVVGGVGRVGVAGGLAEAGGDTASPEC